MNPGDIVTPINDRGWRARVVEVDPDHGWIKVEPLKRPIRSLWLYARCWRLG